MSGIKLRELHWTLFGLRIKLAKLLQAKSSWSFAVLWQEVSRSIHTRYIAGRTGANLVMGYCSAIDYYLQHIERLEGGEVNSTVDQPTALMEAARLSSCLLRLASRLAKLRDDDASHVYERYYSTYVPSNENDDGQNQEPVLRGLESAIGGVLEAIRQARQDAEESP